NSEHAPPADGIQQPIGRDSGGDCTQGSENDHSTVGESKPLLWKTGGERLETPHQSSGYAQAKHCKPDQKLSKTLCVAEQRCATDGDNQKRTMYASGAITIQQNSHWELRSCKDQEVNRCDKAAFRGIEPEIGCQSRGDRRIDCAKQKGE